LQEHQCSLPSSGKVCYHINSEEVTLFSHLLIRRNHKRSNWTSALTDIFLPPSSIVPLKI